MPDQQTFPVTVERDDAIMAAGACVVGARHYRMQARLRRNAGPHNASHRAWLRMVADEMEAVGNRMQAVADEAVR
jgi:hypothetical protein